MLEDVAMPHVLISAGPRTGRNHERHCGQLELHDHCCHFSRIHADGLFPSTLLWTGSYRRSREAWRAVVLLRAESLPGDHLHIDQVEVDRVSIRRKVGDLPYLG